MSYYPLYPNVGDHHNDIDWLIRYYRKLSADYDVLLKKIEAMEDAFANIDPTIQAALAQLRQEVTALKSQLQQEVNAIIAKVQADVNAAIAEVKSTLQGYLNLIIQLEQIVQDYRVWVKRYVDLKDLEIRAYVKDQIQRANELVLLHNPIYGKMQGQVKVMDEVYDFLSFATPCEWVDAVGITAAEQSELRVRAKEWDTKSRWYLLAWWLRKIKPWNMCDPWTGEWVDPRDVITKAVALAQQGVTVKMFDDAQIVEERLDELLVTAFDYDWTSEWFNKLIEPEDSGESED